MNQSSIVIILLVSFVCSHILEGLGTVRYHPDDITMSLVKHLVRNTGDPFWVEAVRPHIRRCRPEYDALIKQHIDQNGEEEKEYLLLLYETIRQLIMMDCGSVLGRKILLMSHTMDQISGFGTLTDGFEPGQPNNEQISHKIAIVMKNIDSEDASVNHNLFKEAFHKEGPCYNLQFATEVLVLEEYTAFLRLAVMEGYYDKAQEHRENARRLAACDYIIRNDVLFESAYNIYRTLE